MLGPIGTQELLVILLLILFIFGAKKIPQLARSLGQGLNEFSRARRESENAPETDIAEESAH